MKNILLKYPVIYLILFCVGGLLLGFEISELIKQGFPEEKVNFYLSLSNLVFTSLLTVYFFYYFVKIKNMEAKK